MIKAVIFDMDGVLVDTERLNWRMGAQVAAERGLELPESLYASTLGRVWQDAVEIYNKYYQGKIDGEYLLEQASARVAQHIEHSGVPLRPGVGEALAWLAARGVPAAVATSTAHALALHKLTAAGLDVDPASGPFRAIIGGDQVARGKPEPDIYLAAAVALGMAPDVCAAVEDSPAGLRAASTAGLHTLMVPDMVAPTDALRAGIAAVLPSLHALPQWLEERM